MRQGTRDLRDAVMWLVATVPAAFGFWVIAAELTGARPEDRSLLLGVSLASMGLATLAQVVAGYRLALFEGPAGSYVAALAVLAAGPGSMAPAQVTGGLLAAALVVLLIAASGLGDRLSRLLTPPVATSFLLVTVVMVVPATFDRAAGLGPSGDGVGSWLPAAVVVVVAVGARRTAATGPYALLLAFAAGVGAHLVVRSSSSSGVSSEPVGLSPLPWGTPELSLGVVLPFVVAAVLGAFNSVATERAVADVAACPPSASRQRRGLVAHGTTLGVTAAMGNLLGNVPRLDSVGIGQLVGSPRLRPVGIAALAMIAMSFAGPLIGALAALPAAVPAALVLVVLATMLRQGVRGAWRLPVPTRWIVVLPAVLPSVVWGLAGDRLGQWVALVANPMLLGTGYAIAADALLRRRGSRAPGRERSSLQTY